MGSAQLGSQHKCVEQPVRPVFPDYLSDFCDYDENNIKQSHLLSKARVVQRITNSLVKQDENNNSSENQTKAAMLKSLP